MGAIDKFLNDYILGEDFKNKTGAFAPREKTKSQLKQEDLAIKRQIASDIQGGGIKNLMPMLANYTVAEPLAFIGSVLPGETFTYKNLSKKLKTPLQYDNEVVKRIFNVDLDSLEGEEKEAAINQIDSFIRKNSNVSGIAEAASFLVGGGFGTKAGTKAGATARKLKDPAYVDELTPNMFKPNNNLPLTSAGAKVVDQPYGNKPKFAGFKEFNEARQGDKLVTLQNLIKEANKNLDNTKTFKALAREAGYQPLSVTGKKFTDKVGVALNKPADNIKSTFQKSFNVNFPVEDFYSLRRKTIEKVTGGTRGPRKENAVNWDNVPQWKNNEKFLKHLEKPENFNKYSGLTFKEAKDIWKGRTKNGKFTYKDIGAGYSSPEMKIIEYARRHVERGGDKIKFTVPITEETMASYNKAKFTYNGKEYSLNSLKQNSRQDSNFDNFYNTFDSLKTIATTRVIHPVTKKELNFDKLMEEVYKKATGSKLRFGEIDHISGVKNNPFDNLRVLDQRTNISSGNIKHFADRSKAGTLNKQTERYSKDNAEKMLEKIGSNYNKKDDEFVKDGVKLAYDVLVKGRTLDTPTQVATKKFGFKLGGEVEVPKNTVFGKYLNGYKKGGRVDLFTGGEVTFFEIMEERRKKEQGEKPDSDKRLSAYDIDEILKEEDQQLEEARTMGYEEAKVLAHKREEAAYQAMPREYKEKVMKEKINKLLNPGKPSKFKLSEIPRLITQNPVGRAALGAHATERLTLPLLATGLLNSAKQGLGFEGEAGDLTLSKVFPMLSKVGKDLSKVTYANEQEYISIVDEVNKMQEAGLANFAFSIVDLAAMGIDGIAGTDVQDRVSELYDDMDIAEPETFLAKLGALGIELGVPGAAWLKLTTRFRKLLAAKTGINTFTVPGQAFSNIAKRMGVGAATFGLADVTAMSDYSTIHDLFPDDPLLLTDKEETEGLSGRKLAAANFRNRLRFGADGAMIGGLFPLVGPPAWALTKLTASGVVAPIIGGGVRTFINPPIEILSKTLAGKTTALTQAADNIAALTTGIRPTNTAEIIGRSSQKISEGIQATNNFLGKQIVTRAALAGQDLLNVAAKARYGTGMNKDVEILDSITGKTTTKAAITFNKQLPDYKDWRMFSVNEYDPLKQNLTRVDNVLAMFRDVGKLSKGAFNLSNESKFFVKENMRKSIDLLGLIERESYNLAKAFESRYNRYGESKVIQQQFKEQIDGYIKGKVKLRDLPGELQQPSEMLNKHLNKLKKTYAELLPDGKLKDFMTNNLQEYMRKSFAMFTNANYYPGIGAVKNARVWLEKEIAKDPLLVEQARRSFPGKDTRIAVAEQAELRIAEFLDSMRYEMNDPIEGLNRAVKKNLGMDDLLIQTGEELPTALKKLLGEENNLKASVLQTTSSLVTQAAQKISRDKIAEMGLKGGWLFRSSDEARDVGKLLNSEQVKETGTGLLHTELVGLSGAPELIAQLNGENLFDSFLRNTIYSNLIAFKAVVQGGKTLYSPATQARNFGSASLFALNQGHIGGRVTVTESFKMIMDDIFGPGGKANPQEVMDNIQRKIRLGVLDENIVAEELGAVLRDFKRVHTPTLATVREGDSKVNAIINSGTPSFTNITQKIADQRLTETVAKMYAGGDNVWKWYGHEYVKSQLKGNIKNIAEVQSYFKNIVGRDFDLSDPITGKVKTLAEGIEEMAAYQIRETYPTYSRVPDVIANLRKLPFGNFVSFPAEMFRTTFAATGLSLKHIASDNPALRTMGYRGLLGQLSTLYGVGETTKAISTYMTGIKEDEIKAFTTELSAPYLRDHQLIPITKKQKNGSFKVFDMSTYNPYAYMIDPIENIITNLNELKLDPSKVDLSMFTTFYDVAGPLANMVSPFLAETLGLEPFFDLLPSGYIVGGRGGVTKMGVRIYSNDDDADVKWNKSFAHVMKGLAPGAINTLQKTYSALQSDLSQGQPIELGDQLFKLMGGSTMVVNPVKSLEYFITDIRDIKKEAFATEKFYSETNWQNRPEAVLIKEFQNIQDQALKQQFKVYRTFQKALDSGLLTKRQIKKVLDKRGFSSAQIRSLINGKFLAVPLSEAAMEKRMKNIKKAYPNLIIERKDLYPKSSLNRVIRKYNRIKFKDLIIQQELDDKGTSQPQPIFPEKPKLSAAPIQEPQVPPLPDSGTPIVNPKQTASVAGTTVSPRTGLTDSESVLLSPTDQLYRRRQRGIT